MAENLEMNKSCNSEEILKAKVSAIRHSNCNGKRVPYYQQNIAKNETSSL